MTDKIAARIADLEQEIARLKLEAGITEEKLYTVQFDDRRGRSHVMLIKAANQDQAHERLLVYCDGRHEFPYDISPELDEMKEVHFTEWDYDTNTDVPVDTVLLYHEDYD